MKDLLRQFWQRLVGQGSDKAHADRILSEITAGTGQAHAVTTRGANLKIAGTFVQIPAGSLPWDCDVHLSPLSHGNVVAGIKVECATDLRVPASWSLPKIGMRFSLRYPGSYIVVKTGKTHKLVMLEEHRARVAVAA